MDSQISSVRTSRDGDQFHYLWASRRCLSLLSLTGDLVSVTIEGQANNEFPSGQQLEAGEEIIDIGEYFGSEDIQHARLIRYMQLKHSTVRTDQHWNPSELENTIKGFAKRFIAFQPVLSLEEIARKLEFWFVSNRIVNPNLKESIEDIKNGISPIRHPANLPKLETFTSLNGPMLKLFCQILKFEDGEDNYWLQRNYLHLDIKGYLPGEDIDAPLHLKELVNRKALSEHENSRSITKHDVLRAFKANETDLFPARCLIKESPNFIPRESEVSIINSIVEANGIPVILHADGGVGKSVFATRIKTGLPSESVVVLYDCFGDGQYRNTATSRHRHKEALVQISNELASLGHCHPLIPTTGSEPKDYLRAFMYRLDQTIKNIRGRNPSAILCIVIDAADNAQSASLERNDPRSFIIDLIRESFPEGVQLVAISRSHRQELLNPPSEVIRLPLPPFSQVETSKHLLQFFPDASPFDIEEFHRLSSANPRVQSLALSDEKNLVEILQQLGPFPTTVDNIIENLLIDKIAKLKDIPGEKIEKICIGLATLRPLIPISVLAKISGVEVGAVKSFALDLRRPLIITETTIQFFDEPSETWFRENFKPKAEDLNTFISILEPMAKESAYVASVLPQLMLEAGKFSELVELALSSEGLPDTNPIERRDVELQRLQFALKACLRTKRFPEAAKLALKAGVESAGNARQEALIQSNTDLAAMFMEIHHIQETVSRKSFRAGWQGSNYAYEAGLLSCRNELRPDAISRLKMAKEWTSNFSSQSEDERKDETISAQDVAEIAMAYFNIYGAGKCASNIRTWMPRHVSFQIGKHLAKRFVDQGRYEDLNDLAVAAKNNAWLILAITLEMRKVFRNPPTSSIQSAFRMVQRHKIFLGGGYDAEENTLQSITALAEAAFKTASNSNEEIINLLTSYLPDIPSRLLSSSTSNTRKMSLKAYSLRSVLSGIPIVLEELAYPELKKELENKKGYDSNDVSEFKETVGAILPLYVLWANAFTGKITASDLPQALSDIELSISTARSSIYGKYQPIINEGLLLKFEIIFEAGNSNPSFFENLIKSINNLENQLTIPTLTKICRICARIDFMNKYSIECATKVYNMVKDVRQDVDSTIQSYVDLSRALLTLSPLESKAYFNKAVEEASKIGDEHFERWAAIISLADRASILGSPNSKAAYEFSRCAELMVEYVDSHKHFNWNKTVESIANLSATSSISILSRWRDRQFGRAERAFPTVVEHIVCKGVLNPKIAICFLGFNLYWDQISILSKALDKCVANDEKQLVLNTALRFMRFNEKTSKIWIELKQLMDKHKLVFLDIDQFIKHALDKEKARDSEPYLKSSSAVEEDKNIWDEIFQNLDLSLSDDIYRAYQRRERIHARGKFFTEAILRTRVGNEARFILAIADIVGFDLYDVRVLLANLPESWKSQLSVKSALGTLIKKMFRVHCLNVTNDKQFDILSIPNACSDSNLSEDELVSIVLSALGEVPENLGARRLFTLVGLISLKLTNSEALEALSYGLKLFENILEEKDGDGEWSDTLEPASDIEASIAGYLWTSLGSPKASTRWEAVHIVRELCNLKQQNVINHLIMFAQKKYPLSSLVDRKLHFYQFHALQWLMISLARSSKENPEILLPHFDFFIFLSLKWEKHILIRGLAAQTAISLLHSGLIKPNTDLEQRLNSINKSKFQVEPSAPYWSRKKSDRFKIKEDVDFNFGMEIGPYWFDPLGRCFNLSEDEVEKIAEKVIAKEMNYNGKGSWTEDERKVREIFSYDDFNHSHGTIPKVDELMFYLSYHAMMITGGQLLETSPTYLSEFDENSYTDWLNDHSLSLETGFLLSDFRTPAPLEWPAWKEVKQSDDWRWSLMKSDFDNALFPKEGVINIWGHWNNILTPYEESIDVRSALVSTTHSISLLRAMQTSTHPYDHRLPAVSNNLNKNLENEDDEDLDDDIEINDGEFFLKAWIIEKSKERDFDSRDPWAGKIRHPQLLPAKFIVQSMGLTSDIYHHNWYYSDDKKIGFSSEVWGQYSETEHNTENESGRRLQANFPFILECLKKEEKDLIVEISIVRKINHRYRGNDFDKINIPPSKRIFVIKSDGNVITV